jgi:SAM-dependent methyltransferase
MAVLPSAGHLRRCVSCGVVYNSAFKPARYDKQYFTHEYAKCYGKTYEQDRDNILALSARRVDAIIRLGGFEGSLGALRLLDIGSAMGFFLEAAKRRGVGAVEGIEISSYAARYCRTKLGIPVVNSSFDDAAIKTAYDVITAWYFIEHCASPLKTAMKIHALLKPGGIWAFSTPSSFGPLYAFHRKEWASRHPEDHRVDFSPASVKGFLKRAGFSRVVVRAGGIHPERVFPEGCFYSRSLGALYARISGIVRFSDTMEVYARKDFLA